MSVLRSSGSSVSCVQHQGSRPVPSFAKGHRKKAGESLDQATDRVMKGGGYRPPYKKGPGSIYNKVRKYLSRN
ncbi:hypothetical protein [Streptomyces sp. NPDC058671]|uniref:hypothetical protein n=1 Tax=Streptomyces sp. NPDC058671 TaxID=3346590 RepID=UPI003652958A